MISAGLPPDESERLTALKALELLDTGADPRFDALTRLASRVLSVPITLVSLIDESRQWFKSRVGMDATETSRDIAFCAYTIQEEEMFVVTDATTDPRFFDNPLVTGDLGLRAYAGVPVRTSGGYAIGTLCALDQKPHEFTTEELETLKDLAALVQREILACETVARWQKKAAASDEAAEDLDRIYSSTVDWAGVGIGLLGLDCTWLRVNPKMCQIFGCTEDDLRGTSWEECSHPEDLSAMKQLRADLLSGKSASGTAEIASQKRDGTPIWIEVTATLLRNAQGQPQSFVLLVDDITKRRATELALQELRQNLEHQVLARTQELRVAKELADEANAAKTRFISNMSHELRTPLNAVLGYARRLGHTDMDATQRSDLQKLQIAGESLLGLVNDVLDMSKIEAGELQLMREVLDLDKVLSDIDGMMGMTASGKNLTLRLNPRPSDVPRFFLGDQLRLRQVLVNLVGNALKFTEQGHVEIRMQRLASANSDKLRLRFDVQDTGIGIPEDELPFLFGRFRQVEDSNARKHGGTGLGLSIVKELAERMGGTVDVRSRKGAGSTFSVEVELLMAPESMLTAPEAQMTEVEAACSSPVPRLEGARILLVDDSPSNLDIAASMLMEEGADVFVCTDGLSALNWLRQPGNTADVVLMDVQMPVMDGNTAVAEIRKIPALASLPVIAMTASSTVTERQASLDAGMNDYVTKPVIHEQLMAALRRTL